MRLPAIFCLLALSVLGVGVNFPSTQKSVSPDGRQTIYCATEKLSDGYAHKIFLAATGSKAKHLVWIANRHCDVLWRQDSQVLAITDWSGSSTAEIYLHKVGSTEMAEPLRIWNLSELVSRSELDGHYYAEALSWNSPTNLVIRVFGHTDDNPSHGFSYYLSVDIGSEKAILLKKTSSEAS